MRTGESEVCYVVSTLISYTSLYLSFALSLSFAYERLEGSDGGNVINSWDGLSCLCNLSWNNWPRLCDIQTTDFVIKNLLMFLCFQEVKFLNTCLKRKFWTSCLEVNGCKLWNWQTGERKQRQNQFGKLVWYIHVSTRTLIVCCDQWNKQLWKTNRI